MCITIDEPIICRQKWFEPQSELEVNQPNLKSTKDRWINVYTRVFQDLKVRNHIEALHIRFIAAIFRC